MPVCKITYPTDIRYDVPMRVQWYTDSEGLVEEYRPFRAGHRMSSLKSILRRVKSRNYPKGTRLVFHNWYVGYASIMVVI